jgi:hypothetical protein
VTPQNLEEANKLILRKIAGSDEETILGFLPLTQVEEEAVLELVRNELNRRVNVVAWIIVKAPAAMLYALAVAPGRTLTDGGKFWPALQADLGIEVNGPKRPEFADRFRRTCRQL